MSEHNTQIDIMTLDLMGAGYSQIPARSRAINQVETAEARGRAEAEARVTAGCGETAHPLYAAPPDQTAEIARLREALDRIARDAIGTSHHIRRIARAALAPQPEPAP